METNLTSHHVLYNKEQSQKLYRARQLRSSLTEAERILWSRLRANKCGGFHFRKQQVIAGFIVDFYCHQARLVVEVDGDIHYSQQEYDEERDSVLKNHGLRVLRFTNKQVKMHLRHTMLTIFRTLDESSV